MCGVEACAPAFPLSLSLSHKSMQGMAMCKGQTTICFYQVNLMMMMDVVGDTRYHHTETLPMRLSDFVVQDIQLGFFVYYFFCSPVELTRVQGFVEPVGRGLRKRASVVLLV
jgi:hypothetical protein